MSVLPKRALFRFRVPCRYIDRLWSKRGTLLGDEHRIPDFLVLEDGADPSPYDLKIGWNESGLAFSLHVFGKRQNLWCRSMHPEESDGFQLCLDTRDVKDVHRATRFCHRLVFLPQRSGSGKPEPCVVWLPIHRAKGHPNPIDLKKIELFSQIDTDGYRLDFSIPGETLTGFEPQDHPAIGFHFALIDRELGNRFFLLPTPFPHDQDPSLWGTLELVGGR